MEQMILEHPQLLSNVGITGVLLMFIVYLINSHKEREKFWVEKFEASYQDLKEQLEDTKRQVEVNHQLFSETTKHYKENSKTYREEVFERLDSIEKNCKCKGAC